MTTDFSKGEHWKKYDDRDFGDDQYICDTYDNSGNMLWVYIMVMFPNPDFLCRYIYFIYFITKYFFLVCCRLKIFLSLNFTEKIEVM